ncbi:MAG: aspartate/glutamate racemase family protein [Phycisphaerae bacterium]
MNAKRIQHIGIVAPTAEGAAYCYRAVVHAGQAALGVNQYPEVSLHGFALAEYLPNRNARNWSVVGDLLLESARKLAEIGADFIIMPCNTMHHAWHHVVSRSPIPWLHIVRVVADEDRRKGFRRLAILGTRLTTEGSVYPEIMAEAGQNYAVPEPEKRNELDRIIFEELLLGKFLDASRRYMIAVIERLRRSGCDAVVLACTEIPLLVGREDSPLLVLDSTKLLAQAAVRRAIGIDEQPHGKGEQT